MKLRYRICDQPVMGKLNLLVKTKLLFWYTICSAFFIKTEANIAVCSPSNTNIAIDAQSPGVIPKPIFPDGSSRTSCNWQIQAPENFRLAITIEALSLNGQDDYLAIRDGATTTSPLIGKYGPCANGSLTLLSSGRSVLLQLESAVHRTTDKLKISYSPTDPGDVNCENSEFPPGICGINTERRGLSGFVTSPNFPSNYDGGADCLWTILAPTGYRLQFSVHFLGIEDHRYSRKGTCGDDSISVSEYSGNATKDIKKFCGCKELFSFVSSEEKIFLTFRSYKKNNWPGFYASYRALAPEDCPRGELDCPRKNVEQIAFNAQSQVCTIIPKKTSSRVDEKRRSSAMSSSSSRLSTLSSSGTTSKYGSSFKETLETISSSPLSPIFILPTSHDSIHTPIQVTISPNRSETSFGKTVDSDDIRPIGLLKTSRYFSLPIIDVEASPAITSSHYKALMTRQIEVGALSSSYQSKYRTRETQSDYITPSKTIDSAALRSSETIGQPSTRDPPITITQSPLRGLAVKCSQFGMEVTISRILLPYLDINSVHLDDPSCTVSFVNDTLAVLSAPLEECGTQHNETLDYLIYRNTMTGDEKSSNSNSSITRDGTVKFEFQCSFRKLRVLSIVSYSTSSKVIYIKDGDGVGNFTFEMNMFEDSKYNLEVKQYPVVVYPGQPMYLQVNVRALDRNLLTFLEECWVTPSTDPRDKTRHTIIQHGCSRDSTLQYDYKKSPIQNFTFKAFQFRKVVSERLYVHCQVVTCRESDTDSVCHRGCRKNGRRKRENKALILDEEVFLSVGPVSRQEQNKESTASEHHGLVVYIKALAWILGTLALILATAMISLILRRRKLLKDKNNSWNLIALRRNDARDEEEKRRLRTPQQDTGN